MTTKAPPRGRLFVQIRDERCDAEDEDRVATVIKEWAEDKNLATATAVDAFYQPDHVWHREVQDLVTRAATADFDKVEKDSGLRAQALGKIVLKLVAARGQTVYLYRKMSADELRSEMAALKMTPDFLSFLIGVRAQRVMRWIKGDEDIPKFLPVLLAALSAPDGFEAAHDKATEMVMWEDTENEAVEEPVS